jgi:hypothetical protein
MAFNRARMLACRDKGSVVVVGTLWKTEKASVSDSEREDGAMSLCTGMVSGRDGIEIWSDGGLRRDSHVCRSVWSLSDVSRHVKLSVHCLLLPCQLSLQFLDLALICEISRIWLEDYWFRRFILLLRG